MSTPDAEQPTNRTTNRNSDWKIWNNNPMKMLLQDQKQQQHS